MSEHNLYNVNVTSERILIAPAELKRHLPSSESANEMVWQARQSVKNILTRKDPRLLMVVGPCSIHDVQVAKEYAERLLELRESLSDELFILMRIYFEKPRTTVGWKGLINDPRLDDSFHIEEGLHKARELLLWLAEKGLPAATEALDPITPQYLSDLYAWVAIGARTTESQTHREMASGLSMPVGFKNGTDGALDVAINALKSVSQPHNFLGINQKGQVTVVQTKGNLCGHVILRGSEGEPNYSKAHVTQCENALRQAGLPENIMIDCSHGNSGKQPKRQPQVAMEVVDQVTSGSDSIIGLMLESNLKSGSQPIPADTSQLEYGVSVTDGCMDWETTESLLRSVSDTLSSHQKN